MQLTSIPGAFALLVGFLVAPAFGNPMYEGKYSGDAQAPGSCETGHLEIAIAGDQLSGEFTNSRQRKKPSGKGGADFEARTIVKAVIGESGEFELATTHVSGLGIKKGARGVVTDGRLNVVLELVRGGGCAQTFSLERR
jgi:hypothetical protein